MIRAYVAGARSADTPAARALKAKLAAKSGGKAMAEPKPALVAPAPKPKAKWTPEIAASSPARAVTQKAIDMMSHPNFEGHRALALKLFQNPKLSGREICSMLALAGSKTEAESDAALAEMQAALADARQSNSGSTTSTSGGGSSRAAAIWAKAHERAFGELGE